VRLDFMRIGTLVLEFLDALANFHEQQARFR
jgi:hypothetical protein